jgi:hypothetical protein
MYLNNRLQRRKYFETERVTSKSGLLLLVNGTFFGKWDIFCRLSGSFFFLKEILHPFQNIRCLKTEGVYDSNVNGMQCKQIKSELQITGLHLSLKEETSIKTHT